MPPVPSVTAAAVSAPPKKRNFACESCRAKKRRCDGGQPRCRLCTALKTECIYKGIPSAKYLSDLEGHCAQLRATLLQLKHASAEEREALLSDMDDRGLSSGNPANAYASGIRLSGEAETGLSSGPSDRKASADGGNGAVKDEVETLSEMVREQAKISTDEVNRLSLHGPSSLFYLSSSTNARNTAPTTAESINETLNLEHHLMLDWIDRVAVTASFPVMSEEVWRYVLRMHFTWVQPMFGFVHHKTFMRDMHRPRTQQSMFSPFLLYCLCTHVIRQCDVNLLSDGVNPSDPFLPQAKLLVLREVENGSSLSAIGGLLALSAKVMTLGHVSPSWVYLGMAVRMLDDLGIHLDGKLSADSKFTQDELECRRHMFWATYMWDKTVSIYLGRAPMLQLSRYSPMPVDAVGNAELDNQPWTPVGNRLDKFPPFTPTPALELLNFANSTRLAVVMNEVLLYDAGHENALKLDQIRAKLTAWEENLPKSLHFHPKDEPSRVPPAHVINLNCLGLMLSILIDRRQTVGVVQDSSVRAALDIAIMAQLSQKQFIDRQAVLSHCYCIYTAAVVFVNKLRQRSNESWLSEEDAVLVMSLQWCLNRLSNASTSISALYVPVTVLHEKVGQLPEPVRSVIIAATAPPPAPPTRSYQGDDTTASPDSSRSGSSPQGSVSSQRQMTLESALAQILASEQSPGSTADMLNGSLQDRIPGKTIGGQFQPGSTTPSGSSHSHELSSLAQRLAPAAPQPPSVRMSLSEETPDGVVAADSGMAVETPMDLWGMLGGGEFGVGDTVFPGSMGGIGVTGQGGIGVGGEMGGMDGMGGMSGAGAYGGIDNGNMGAMGSMGGLPGMDGINEMGPSGASRAAPSNTIVGGKNDMAWLYP